MKVVALFAASACSCLAAIGNLRVLGTTATQALIAYTAPDANACTIQVSESPGLTPLVLDMDPAIFANSNIDLSRPSTVTSGRSREVVIGQRTAQHATAGTYSGVRHFSRALQAYTPHYGAITCPSTGETATFKFTTGNIPIGGTYGDPWLSDAAHPGDQPWPETLGGANPEYVNDPTTGILTERIGLRSNDYYLWSPASLNAPVFSTAYNQGQNPCDSAGPWTNPCGSIVSGGAGNTTVGNSAAPLVLRLPMTANSAWAYGQHNYSTPYSLDQLAVNLTGYGNSNTAGWRAVWVCLSMNGGASCANTPWLVTLGTSSSTQTAGQLDKTQYGVTPWLLDSNPRINMEETTFNRGTNTVSGNTLTWASANSTNFWSLYWTTGGNGRIRLSTVSYADACAASSPTAAEYTITGYTDGLHMTVTPTPPAGSNYWCANNFTVMIWRANAPITDSSTITLTSANMSVLESYSPSYPDNGAGTGCMNTLVQGGYFCLYGGLYWFNPTTGASVYYGYMSVPNPGITNSWNTVGLTPSGETANIDQSQSVLTWYFLAGDPAGGGPLVIRGVFNPTTIVQPAVPYANGSQIGNATVTGTTAYSVTYSNGLTFTNMTPQNPGGACQTLVCQMATFDPTFNAYTYSHYLGNPGWNCTPYGMSAGIFFPVCYADNQDSMGWIFAFSPGDGNPAHAGQAGGPGIVGAINTFNTPNGPVGPTQTAMTGRTLHALAETGETGWISINTHWGPTLNTTSSTIPSSSADCSVFGLPTGHQCIQLSIVNHTSPAPCVTGCTGYEPYLSNRQYQFTGAPGETRIAKIGDTVCVGGTSNCDWGSGANEMMSLQIKDYNGVPGAWVFQRNLYNSEKAISTTPINLWWASRNFIPPGSSTSGTGLAAYWSPLTGCAGLPDPHGACLAQNPNETFSHGEWRDGGSSQATNVPSWDANGGQWPTDYQNTVGPVPAMLSLGFANLTPFQTPDVNFTSYSPPFAGTWGHPWTGEAGTHPNPAGANASAYESIRAFDNTPYQGSSASPNFTLVTGQLYNSTPASVTDPDDFFGTGGKAMISRKLMAQGLSCGAHPLIDISGPGSVIATDATGSYTACFSRVANECRPASTVGQVFVNCPGVVTSGGSIGCNGNALMGGTPMGVGNDICVGNQGAANNAIRQYTLDRTDYAGAYTRTLVGATSRLRMVFGFENNRLLPDNSWLLYRSEYLNYQRYDMWAAKVPPFPAADSVNRGTFVPVSLTLRPPAGLTVNNAIVQFGYQEYGAPQLLNCTTRNDACIATASTVLSGRQPFSFASENHAGAPCSSGCIVTIPAISQRILYYRIQYRAANNSVIAVNPLVSVVVP